MNAIVVYATRHRNTKKIAEAIAEGLRTKGGVDVFDIDDAPVTFDKVDLVVVGGPTEAHSATPPAHAYLAKIEQGALDGVRVASFDTRLRLPRWISGAASIAIGKALERAGGDAVAPPESFMVKGNPVGLEPGELERAETWGVYLAGKVVSRETVSA